MIGQRPLKTFRGKLFPIIMSNHLSYKLETAIINVVDLNNYNHYYNK